MMPGFIHWLIFAQALAVVAAPAVYALRRTGSGRGWGETALLGFLIGLQQFILIAHAIFIMGAPVSLVGLILATGLHTLACLGWARAFAVDRQPAPGLPPIQRLVLLFIAFAIVFFALAIYSFTQAESDSLFYWLARGWTFALHGDARIYPYLYGPTYPLAVPLGDATFILLGNAVGVALWQHAYLFGVLFYAMIFLNRRLGGHGLLMGALLIAPQLLFYPRSGAGFWLYADTTLAAALLLSCLLMIDLLEGRRSWAWAASVSLCFFALTKVNAALYLVALLPAFGFVFWFADSKQETRRAKARLLIAVVGPPLIVVALWRLLPLGRDAETGVAHYAMDILKTEILSARSPWEVYGHKLRLSALFLPRALNLAQGPASAALVKLGWTIPLVLGALWAWPLLIARERFLALGSAFILFLIVAVMYCLVGGRDDSHTDWWLRTGYLRALVHVMPLFVLCAQLILARLAAAILGPVPWFRALVRVSAKFKPDRKTWIALALFPLAFTPWLLRVGTPHRGMSRLNRLIQREDPPGLPDVHGLHVVEYHDGVPMRWTGEKVRMGMLVQGRKLVVTYEVRHPDLSPANPVEVRIALDGLPERIVAYDRPGIDHQKFDISNWDHSIIDFELTVNRVWDLPDGRRAGVLLYPIHWE